MNQLLLLKIITAMQAVEPYLNESSHLLSVTLEYRTPASQLRHQADEIERRDKAITEFRTVLAELKALEKK